MKNVIFFAVLLIFTGRLQAQTFNLGISGGYNATGVFGSQGSTYFTSSSGFNAGALADYNWHSLTAESGLFFTTKGYGEFTRLETFYSNGLVSIFNSGGKTTLNYLEIPFNLLYNFRLPFGKFFIGGGVFFDDPLSGNTKGGYSEYYSNGSISTTEFNDKTPIGNGANEFKTYTGFEATTGIRFKNGLMIALKVQGAWGNMFTDVAENVNPGDFKSMGYSISAGYMFL